MPANLRILSYAAASVLALGVMGGCATQTPAKSESKPAAAPQPATAATDNYFIVFHENGRISEVRRRNHGSKRTTGELKRIDLFYLEYFDRRDKFLLKRLAGVDDAHARK